MTRSARTAALRSTAIATTLVTTASARDGNVFSLSTTAGDASATIKSEAGMARRLRALVVNALLPYCTSMIVTRSDRPERVFDKTGSTRSQIHTLELPATTMYVLQGFPVVQRAELTRQRQALAVRLRHGSDERLHP